MRIVQRISGPLAGSSLEVARISVMLVALLHAVVAIWHQAARKDCTMTRMTKAKA